VSAVLKPCPFCGSEAQLASYNSCDCCGKAWNGCVNCPGCGAEISHRDTDEEAIAAWNTRPEAADLISEYRGALEEVRGCLDWIQHQAENAMGTTAGCATTHGDPGGGLEEANRYASDIAINCQMQAEKIDAALAATEQAGDA
jgi:Lar family restriction alleviation protein